MGSPLLVEPAMVDTLLMSGTNAVFAFQAGLSDYMPLLFAETSFLEVLVARIWNILQVALGLGFVIFVHELGHFLAAKTFGVRCDKFYVGFDVPISIGPIKFPRTLGKFQWGETEYGIGIIPLGGYVKMLGQDDDPRQAEAEAQRVRDGGGEAAPLDPRSYPAKPVWQRMIIISAGVVMNLIFAVILAGIAFRVGVPYTPTVASGTYAGGPAWTAAVEPGDQIVRIDTMKEDDPKLWYHDFSTSVVMRGLDLKDAPMTLALLRDGQRIETTVVATNSYSDNHKNFYLIGVTSQLTPVLGSQPFASDSFVAKSKPDLQAGDIITAINGEELPVDDRLGKVLGTELTSRFHEHWRDSVTLTIERPAKDTAATAPATVKVDIPAVPVKSLGIGFAVGPVTAIQKGSIGEKAGIQVGDVIEEINGTKVVDGFRLPDMAAQLAGQEISLKLRRAPAVSTTPTEPSAAPATDAAESSLVEVTFQAPSKVSFDAIAPITGRLSLGGVGVAFNVLPEVTMVSPGVAEEAGIVVGDRLAQYQWTATKDEKSELQARFSNAAFESQVVDDSVNLTSFFEFLQAIPEGSQIKLFMQRDGKTREATLPLAYADDWYWNVRGVALTQLQQIHKADSFQDAVGLGLWETQRRFKDVLNFLRLLVSGKIGASGLGGPLMIASVASSEASNGMSRLLIFLTLLSANLAILNFLPIPALDGGHMLFLTAEAIRGKPLNEALQVRLTMVGVLGLLSLMAFVIVNDIIRWL